MNVAAPVRQTVRILVRSTSLAPLVRALVQLGSRSTYARTGRVSAGNAFAPMALRAVDARLLDRPTASAEVLITDFQVESQAIGRTTLVSTNDNGLVFDLFRALPWTVLSPDPRGVTFDSAGDDDLDWAR
jgi:hypothetical protein